MRSLNDANKALERHPPGSWINDKGQIVRPRPEADPWFEKSQILWKLRATNEDLIDDCRPSERVPEPEWAAECDIYYPPGGHGQHVDAVHSVVQARSWLLRELLSDSALMSPPAMLVAGLLRLLGITLFHGREKLGKSTFIAQLVAAITSGTIFLGQQLSAAFVVWIAADEPIQDAALRLKRYGANQDRVLIVDGRRGPDELASELATAKGHANGLPLIVVVDTLAELVSPMITSENDSAPMIKALRRYIDVIRSARAACVLIHHSNKSGSDYRGSQAIGGIVDAVVHFRERYAAKVDPNAPPQESEHAPDSRRVLEIRSRWAGHEKRHLSYASDRYVLGDAPVPLEQRILMHLTTVDAISGSRLAEVLTANKKAVFETLARLVETKAVHRSGTGKQTAFSRLADSRGTEAEPHTHSENAVDEMNGTEAEPQESLAKIASVPELLAQRGAPEPKEDDHEWNARLAEAPSPDDDPDDALWGVLEDAA